jgi:hypothetical protein
MWNLDGVGKGSILDLGPAWQTTLSFFIERGFLVSSNDLLSAWNGFLEEEGVPFGEDPGVPTSGDAAVRGRIARFLEVNLQYKRGSLDAVLLWDLLEFLEPELANETVGLVTELLRPGGLVFAMFHSKKPEGFRRYRVVDSSTLEMISASVIRPFQKVYQSNEIQELFRSYRTMKSFVGRDQLREALFVK